MLFPLTMGRAQELMTVPGIFAIDGFELEDFNDYFSEGLAHNPHTLPLELYRTYRKWAAHIFLEYHHSKWLNEAYESAIGSKSLKAKKSSGKIDMMILEFTGLVDLPDFSDQAQLFTFHLKQTQDMNINDMNGMKLIHGVCMYGNSTMLNLLNNSGALFSAEDKMGYNGLHYASMTDNVAIATSLLSHSQFSNLMYQPSRQLRLPIHVAAVCGSIKVLKAMIGHSRSILHERDGEGKTALWLAVYYHQGEIVRHIMASNFSASQYNNLFDAEPKLTFTYRLAKTFPGIAKQMLEKFVIQSDIKNIKYCWEEEAYLITNGILPKQSHDPAFVLSLTSNHCLSSIIEHKIVANQIGRRWHAYGKLVYAIYMILKWLYILLWTGIYVVDSPYFLTSNKNDNLLKILLICNLGVLLAVCTFDLSRLISSHLAVYRYFKYSDHLDNHMKSLLHPKSSPFFHRLGNMDRNRNFIRRLLHRLNCTLSGFTLFEYLIDICSLVALIYVFVLVMSDTNRLSEVGLSKVNNGTRSVDDFDLYNQPRDYMITIIIVMQWFVGLVTLRIFRTTAYLLEVVKAVTRDVITMSLLFSVIFIPFFVMFWETIYSWGLAESSSTKNVTAYLLDLEFTFFETFRKSHLNYDYDLGLGLVNSKESTLSIHLTWWWYLLQFVWSLLSTVILINMLISLMNETTAQIEKKSRKIQLLNTLQFLYEVHCLMPNFAIERNLSYYEAKKKYKRLIEFSD